jgi:septal ring factor EnvC (AmiA/AmiB activator)
MLKKLFTGAGITSILLCLMMFVSSCSNKLTEEQLKQLTDLRKLDKNLQESVQKKQSEKNSIQTELSKRKSELSDCTKQSDFIKAKLQQWPNVWPDDMFPKEAPTEEPK